MGNVPIMALPRNTVFNSCKAGCCYITQYENYVFLCYGNDEVYVIDLDSRRVVKKYEIGQMSTIAQYDPRRNALFVSVWKNLVILGNVL